MMAESVYLVIYTFHKKVARITKHGNIIKKESKKK